MCLRLKNLHEWYLLEQIKNCSHLLYFQRNTAVIITASSKLILNFKRVHSADLQLSRMSYRERFEVGGQSLNCLYDRPLEVLSLNGQLFEPIQSAGIILVLLRIRLL